LHRIVINVPTNIGQQARLIQAHDSHHFFGAAGVYPRL
jgi:hypothetical protein